MDVEGFGGRESSSAGFELGGFLDCVDGGDEEEVGDLGGEGFAFI